MVVCGKIWIWEERVQSHNAGLPTEAPRNGRFLMDPPWMVIRGGHRALPELRYRVGTSRLGVNRLQVPPREEWELYRLLPLRVLCFRVARSPLGLGKRGRGFPCQGEEVMPDS